MNEDLVAYFKAMGVDDSNIDAVIKGIRIRDLNLIDSRAQFWLSYLNVSKARLARIITKWPNILTYDKYISAAKIEEYKKLLRTDDAHIRKIVIDHPQIIGRDVDEEGPTSIKGKLKFYKKLLGLNDEEVAAFALKWSQFFGYDIEGSGPTSINSKIEFYKSRFNLSNEQMAKIVLYFPSILGLDINSNSSTSVKSKISYIQETFNFSDEDLSQVFIRFPQMFAFDINGDQTSIKTKVDFYKKSLNMNDKEVARMVRVMPQILGYNVKGEGSTRSSDVKIEKLKSLFGEDKTKEILLKKPMILSAPAQFLKIRYMLAETMDIEKAFILYGTLTSQDKVWARYCYLRDIGNKTYGPVYRTDRSFDSTYKVSSSELVKRYPLDKDAIDFIEKSCRERTKRDISLSDDERRALGE